MTYAIGCNMPGYLPESEVFVADTFDEAKAVLIEELKFAEDHSSGEDMAEVYCAAAEEVNLWSGPDNVTVGDYVFWVDVTDVDLEGF